METDDQQDVLRWSISVPIFRNTVIVKQLGIALGIPLGIAAIVIVLTSGQTIYTIYALGLMGAMLLLAWLFVMVVYGGKYDLEFMLDHKGVLCKTQTKQAKKNKVINTLTVVLGVFFGKASVAGAGMLAQSRQEVFLSWSHISKVSYHPYQHNILLWRGWTEQVALFCTEDDYREIEQKVKLHTCDVTRRVTRGRQTV